MEFDKYGLKGGGKLKKDKVYRCCFCGNKFSSKNKRKDHEKSSCRMVVSA